MPRAFDDVMWPLRVISDKLFKMAGDDDGGGGGQGLESPSADGLIPLARRSYYVDVSFPPSLPRPISSSSSLVRVSVHMCFPHYWVCVDKFGSCSGPPAGGARFHMCNRPSPGTAASLACSWCSGRWGFIAATALPISRGSAAPQGSL